VVISRPAITETSRGMEFTGKSPVTGRTAGAA
jgi:hypothetical protein